MTDLKKRIFAVLLITGLCVHFSFIYVYATPYKCKSKKINFVSWYYVSPFFHQQWGLFAPTPKKHLALYVRYQINHRWFEWNNLLQQEINQHHHNVIMGNELYVLMYSNSLIYLVNTLKPENRVFNEELNDITFQILKHEINHGLILSKQLKKETPFEILITSTENKQSSNYYFKNLHIQ